MSRRCEAEGLQAEFHGSHGWVAAAFLPCHCTTSTGCSKFRALVCDSDGTCGVNFGVPHSGSEVTRGQVKARPGQVTDSESAGTVTAHTPTQRAGGPPETDAASHGGSLSPGACPPRRPAPGHCESTVTGSQWHWATGARVALPVRGLSVGLAPGGRPVDHATISGTARQAVRCAWVCTRAGRTAGYRTITSTRTDSSRCCI